MDIISHHAIIVFSLGYYYNPGESLWWCETLLLAQ